MSPNCYYYSNFSALSADQTALHIKLFIFTPELKNHLEQLGLPADKKTTIQVTFIPHSVNRQTKYRSNNKHDRTTTLLHENNLITKQSIVLVFNICKKL